LPTLTIAQSALRLHLERLKKRSAACDSYGWIPTVMAYDQNPNRIANYTKKKMIGEAL